MSFLSKVRRLYVLAGEVVKVDFGKKPSVEVQPHPEDIDVSPEMLERMKAASPTQQTKYHIKRAEQHGIPMGALVDRFSKDDQFRHKFNKAMNLEHDEPYYGGDPHTKFRSDEEKESKRVVPFPLPVVVKDLKGILGKGVPQGTGADPFMWMDAKHGATKAALKSHADKPLDIHTRSDMIAHDDYMALLNPNKHKVFMHLFTTDPEVSRVLEPGVPSPKRRLQAAAKLKADNINVTIVHDILDASPFVQKGLRNELEGISGFKIEPNKLELSAKDKKRLTDAVKNAPKTTKEGTLVPMQQKG